MHDYVWTHSGARLRLLTATRGHYNWVFLPGGPGLGSDYLEPLAKKLTLPGRAWLLDLPGDGSNVISSVKNAFSRWQQGLIEAVGALNDVVMVGHSTGGMYILATPALERKLSGLVLLSSSPDTSFFTSLSDYMTAHPIPGLSSVMKRYSNKPTNALLKKMTMMSAPYSFLPAGMKKGAVLMSQLPYNVEACEWSSKYFDHTYQAKWIPRKVPTLILSGRDDHIIPSGCFLKAKGFQRKNIMHCSIPRAGHYPWVEKPKQVADAFKRFTDEYFLE